MIELAGKPCPRRPSFTRHSSGSQTCSGSKNTTGEMATTGFGLNQQTLIRKAIVQAIKAAKLWVFNCLEITEVKRKSLLGVSFIKIATRGRHIQVTPCFENVGESR